MCIIFIIIVIYEGMSISRVYGSYCFHQCRKVKSSSDTHQYQFALSNHLCRKPIHISRKDTTLVLAILAQLPTTKNNTS